MLKEDYAETLCSAFYVERVNNMSYINMFGDKYKNLIRFIDSCVYRYPDLIVKEEGCGIGNVSKAHHLFGQHPAKKYLLTDVDNRMLMIATKNMEGIPNVEFANENILEECDYPEETLVITHGVLEHFSDDDLLKTMHRHKHENVKHQGHYVPLNGYSAPSFGDERLLSAMDWIYKMTPNAIEMNENKDLFMYF